jgi:hypothetical protein
MMVDPLRRAPPALLAALCLGPLAAAARPPVIDIHVHTEPGRYGLALDVLASNGVSRFVNLSGGSPGHGLEESLDAAYDAGGRILVCVNPEWRKVEQPDFAADQVRMLAVAKAEGARCLKVTKALGLMVPDPKDPNGLLRVDDPRLDPLWEAAGRLGLPVFWHVGDPKAFFEPASPTNERWDELQVHPDWSFADPKFPRWAEMLDAFERVLSRHPHTTFIGVHFGNCAEDVERVDRMLREHPNLYVDVAARVPEIGRQDAEKVRQVFLRYQDRILFGTDFGLTGGIMLGSVGRTRPGLADIDLFYYDHYRWFETRDRQIPHPTPIQGNWRIDSIGLPEDVLAKIYSGNALKLLWGEAGPGEVDRKALEEAPGPAELHGGP